MKLTLKFFSWLFSEGRLGCHVDLNMSLEPIKAGISTSDIGNMFLSILKCTRKCRLDPTCTYVVIPVNGQRYPYECVVSRDQDVRSFLPSLVDYYGKIMKWPPLFYYCPSDIA